MTFKSKSLFQNAKIAAGQGKFNVDAN